MAGSPRALTPQTSRRPRCCWKSWRDNLEVTTRCGYASPNAVTPAHTHGSPLLCFLPHSPSHLCYDALAYEHGGRAPGQGGHAVDFVAVVDQAIALLRQRGRLTYRTLQRQFQLDDAALEDLKVSVWLVKTRIMPPLEIPSRGQE